jgi:3'-phosphoadenosine 5'-phosphosulfate sulfotransferase (PAPS reductase)/FAD synthetase
MFPDIIKNKPWSLQDNIKTNPIETVTRDDVYLYLKLGRQPAGKPLFRLIFLTLEVKVID